MKTRWPLLMVLSASLCAGHSLFAADPVKIPASPTPDMHTHEMGADLELTPDQRSKMQALHEKEREAMKPYVRKERDLMTKLKDQVSDKASDVEISKTLEQLQASRKELMERVQKSQKERDTILTPTQRAKMMLHHRWSGGMDHDGHHEGWKKKDGAEHEVPGNTSPNAGQEESAPPAQ